MKLLFLLFCLLVKKICLYDDDYLVFYSSLLVIKRFFGDIFVFFYFFAQLKYDFTKVDTFFNYLPNMI